MEFKVYEQLWFAVPVWECKVENIDNDSIYNYCLQARKTTPGTVISNRGGWHSSEILQPLPVDLIRLFSDVESFANSVSARHIGVTDLKVGNFWININGPGNYNILHDHQKSILSGVYYVSVPEDNMGDLVLHRGDTAEYFLTSNVKREPTMSNSFSVSKKPQQEWLYLFPSWIKHHVEANNSNKERISIAFNLVV